MLSSVVLGRYEARPQSKFLTRPTASKSEKSISYLLIVVENILSALLGAAHRPEAGIFGTAAVRMSKVLCIGGKGVPKVCLYMMP